VDRFIPWQVSCALLVSIIYYLGLRAATRLKMRPPEA
jgi:hypothetical protein